MNPVSASSRHIIDQCINDYTRLLYLIIDPDFIVKSWSGDFLYYGFEAIQEGQDCRNSLLFMVGLNVHESLQLRFIETPNGRVAHANLFNDAGEIILVLLDATEQRKNHSAIQQKSNELALLHREQTKLFEIQKKLEKEVELKHRQAQQANRLKSKFIGTMSHEFRSPLTSILGYTSRLKQLGGNDPITIKFLGSVERGAQHLLSLVENLLDHSQIEVKSLSINPIATNVNVVLEKLSSIFEPLAEDKHLQLRLEITTELPKYLLLDEMRFRQIMVNLISNAIKFTERGIVNITVGWTNEKLTISVEDTGRGIAEADQKRIFNAFERIGKQSGTGLGLSIVKHLVEAMDGQLALASNLGKGSRFDIAIPAQITSAIGQAHPAVLPSLKQPQKTILRSILIIEDDPDIMSLLVSIFDDTECKILLASTGQSGLDKALSACPDFVLLDLNLPDISGFDVLRSLRSNRFENPVFVQSAWASSETKASAIAAGCNEYILKPLDFDHLKQLLSSYFKLDAHPGMPVERYKQLSQKFSASLPQKLATLKTLKQNIEQDDWNELARKEMYEFAHKLAGSAGLYKLPLIGRTSDQLDKLLKSYDPKETDGRIVALREKISHKISLLCQQIEQAMSQRKSIS